MTTFFIQVSPGKIINCSNICHTETVSDNGGLIIFFAKDHYIVINATEAKKFLKEFN
jgi:hypothetical protein